ncbi:MAG: hypothetical protein VSS75_024050 [Candidatus Parabeggiatoa sp.]|nr:hypothetical protein [Candidatus Parabeggiatoa sp.]
MLILSRDALPCVSTMETGTGIQRSSASKRVYFLTQEAQEAQEAQERL